MPPRQAGGGWGHALSLTAKGLWSESQARQHINLLEMWTVELSLKALLEVTRNKIVLVRSDNVTVVAYINRQGGTKSTSLCLHVRQLLLWARDEGMTLRAQYIPGVENTLADNLSRGAPLTVSEWSLSTPIVNQVFQMLWRTNFGSVCDISESQTSRVLHKGTRSKGVGSGRINDRLDRDVGLRVSPHSTYSRSFEEAVPGGLRPHSDSALLATASVVPGDFGSSGGHSDSVASVAASVATGQVQQSREVAPDCLAVVSKRYQKEGFPKEIADLIAGGRRSSTNRVYSARLKFYFEWCRRRKITPTNSNVVQITQFLKSRFDDGLEVATVKGYLSAIQAIHDGITGVTSFLTHRPLKLFLEGLHNLRPPKRKIWPAWDLPTVLKYLETSPFEPMGSASMRDTALKAAFLLALASGRRCSEIHACAIGRHIVFGKTGVTLYFKRGFLAKNERLNFQAKPIHIPQLRRAHRINCPVRALKWYMNKTQIFRGDHSQLFVTSTKHYRPVAKATIANWIVNVITGAGALESDTPPTAHSTRHISTSWAFAHGVSVAEIINTVAWKSESTFISTYMKDITPRTTFANVVLSASKSS